MRKGIRLFVVLMTISLFFSACNNRKTVKLMKREGPEKIAYSVLPFSPTEVRLLDGPLKRADALNQQVLLNYQPDRFLAGFRKEAGLPPKANIYGGWESESLAGHSLGHYLSACSRVYENTGDTTFLNRVNYIIDELHECQQKSGNGFIGAIPGLKEIFEQQLAKGKIVSHGFDMYGFWSPFYTFHKELAGLIDARELCNNEKALTVARSFADWVAFVVKDLNDEQWQQVVKCEYGGINESFAELYALTGEEKYLTLAERFNSDPVFTSLRNSNDNLGGKHGNTQIAKVLGEARIYELNGDTTSEKIATYFWDQVVNHHSYVTGGNSDHEHFSPADSLSNYLSEGTTETCNVYNMLKLTDYLFSWNDSVKYTEFYERALFNHILSSQNPDNGKVIYNLSLKMGGHKVYQEPEWFTCCVGTGMENHARYTTGIYYHAHGRLYVNQFIASELDDKEIGLKLRQTTQFPEEQGTTLEFSCKEPVQFELYLRYPSWAKNGFEVLLNGKSVKVKQKPGNYFTIGRKWLDGDKLEVKFPFSLYTQPMPDKETRVAIMYGPLVMAGVLGDVQNNSYPGPLYVPVMLLKEKKLTDCIVAVTGELNTFTTTGIGYPRDVTLIPFYAIHGVRYSIYWDTFSANEWKRTKDAYQSDLTKKNKIEEMTVDFFQPGEMQSERDHSFADKNSKNGELHNRKYRAAGNGWFSCKLGVYQGQPMALVVDYPGKFEGKRLFNIVINDVAIATEELTASTNDDFISVQYEIPDKLTFDQNYVIVKFQPHNGCITGPVAGIRTMRR